MKASLFRTALAALLLAAPAAMALGPQECVILVNRRSMQSVELANYYAELRQIPAINIIHLELPDKAKDAGASFSPEEYRQHILEPTKRILRERGLFGHVLAWLYSLDFPTIINTQPPMSLTGMTFVRGEPPPSDQITNGEWLSPLFTGPDRDGGPASPSSSLENYTVALLTNMPIPSMMIGWSGSRGMTMDQIKEQLRAAAASDAAQPLASAFFEVNDDIRSKTRQWQFGPSSRELAGLGIAVFAASNAPAGRDDLIGVLAGRAVVAGTDYGRLKPGSYADHLTSFGGYFHDPYQSKLTEWLKRGAAASSGTIAEPGSREVQVKLWAKFPSARFFTHYASGCTMIESLYQSTRSPLQILFVGDALCSPWAKPPGITLISMADDEEAPVKDNAEFLASSWGGFGQAPPTVIFFLDGRPLNHPGNQTTLKIDTAQLNDGYHELRVVAYAHETVRHQGSDILGFTTRNLNRWSTIGGYSPRQKVDLYHPLTFTINAAGNPAEAAIVAQERIIARAPYATNMTLEVHPMLVGAGPVSFQAVVVYPDKVPVRSTPLPLEIAPLNKAPVIADITVATNDAGEQSVQFSATDPENDPMTLFWYYDLLKEQPTPKVANQENILQLDSLPGQLALAVTNGPSCAVFDVDAPNRIKELSLAFQAPDGSEINHLHHGGVVFNYVDENNYMFWGLDGQLDAWTLIRKRDGSEERILSRGAPVKTGQRYQLAVIALGTQQMALFVDDNLMAVTDLTFGAGSIGVRSGQAVARFEGLNVCPPSAARSYFTETETEVRAAKANSSAINALAAVARDVQLTTAKPVLSGQ